MSVGCALVLRFFELDLEKKALLALNPGYLFSKLKNDQPKFWALESYDEIDLLFYYFAGCESHGEIKGQDRERQGDSDNRTVSLIPNQDT